MQRTRQNPDDGPAARRPWSLYGAVLLGAGLYACLLAYQVISTILLSFLLILLISLALNPLVLRLREISGRRGVAVTAVVAVFVIVAAIAGVAFFAPLKTSGARFVSQLSGNWHRLQEPLAKMKRLVAVPNEAPGREPNSQDPQSKENKAGRTTDERIDPAAPGNADSKSGISQSAWRESLHGVLSSVKEFAVNAVSLTLVAITVFFGTIFTLLNPYPIISSVFALVPERGHAKAMAIFRRFAHFVPRWAFATSLAMITVGLMVFLTMWPILGLADALALGFIACVLEAIPYFGPMLTGLLAFLLALGQGGWTPLWVLLIYVVIQTLETNVISPVIMAGRLDLHPLAIIFSILLCGAAFGVLGALLAVPMVAIVRILYDELYQPHFLPNVTNEDLDEMARTALSRKKP